MKRISQLFLTVFILTCFAPEVFSQKHQSPFNSESVHVAREIMTQASYCALITMDSKGEPDVRTMDPLPPTDEMVVWLGTNPKSRKVQQIQNNSVVTLHYFDQSNPGYVTIRGIAEIVSSAKEKEEHFKSEWEPFYPDKEDGFLLIKVVPVWLELISSKDGMIGDSITWKAPRIEFDVR